MDKNTKKIQPHEAEAILEKFKDNKWLVEKDGIILLSTRFIYEMEPFLKDVYTDFVNQCSLCRKIAIRCIECPDENCDNKYHAYCIREIRQKTGQNPKCPQCKSILPERFVGVGNHRNGNGNGNDESGSPDRIQYQSQPGQKRKRIQQMESDSD